MNISELLSDLTVHYNALIRQSASHIGLTASQAFHLISIPHDGISMTRLSRKLGLDASTLTRNIQKLEKMGMVDRFPDSYDKRVQKTLLTKRGCDTVQEIDEMLLHAHHMIMDNIDLDSQENISNVLEKLVWAMDCIREEQ